jgi:hypothetical protein
MKTVRQALLAAAACLLLVATGLAQDDPSASAETPPAPEAKDSLTVAEIGFGTGYDRAAMTLEGEATEFPPDVGRVYCRTRVTGASTSTQITHVWYHDGEAMAKVVLPIGSANWRTYSSKAILPVWTGLWEVKVLDAHGTIIGEAGFTIR